MNHNNITAAIHDPDDSDDEAEYILLSAALLPFKADLKAIDGLTGFRPTLSSAHVHGHTYCDME